MKLIHQKFVLSLFLALSSLFPSCAQQENSDHHSVPTSKTDSITIRPDKSILGQRFSLPPGFQRIDVDSNSFEFYLRNIRLKEVGSPVLLFNGKEKYNTGVHAAVVDLPIGNRDLHQCADAVMRLRAEYLYIQKKYDKIGFHFTNGFYASYAEWRKGRRIKVNGNDVHWTQPSNLSNDYNSFWKYLETVFTYAGTLSLSKEMKSKNLHNMQIGDVFLQGGSPGHAIIVMDMAVNKTSGETIFMLAQSYMPAQEIHILNNPTEPNLSPWYKIPENGTLETPEWDFSKSDLFTFED